MWIFIIYLADSGITKGVSTTKIRGADVTMANSFQFAIKYAIQGKTHAAAVKNNAIDMFATNVRYLGPTYSRTAMKY